MGSSSTDDPAIEQPIDLAISGFRKPNSDGLIESDQLIPSIFDPTAPIIDGDGDGYIYTAARVRSAGFGAFSGVLPATNVEASPVTGSIEYQAEYEMDFWSNIMETDQGPTAFGNISKTTGAMVLVGNFESNTLTGTDGELSISGQIADSGNFLTGTVAWEGITGELSGLVGSNKSIGAFHGNDDDIVFAGGFIGTAISE